MAENLSFTQGETVSFVVTVTDKDGAPIDITADSFDCEVRNPADLTAKVAEFTPTKLAAVPPATIPNKVRFTLSSTVSSGLTPNMGYNTKGVLGTSALFGLIYDVFRLTPGSPVVRRKLTGGNIFVYPAATKDFPI